MEDDGLLESQRQHIIMLNGDVKDLRAQLQSAQQALAEERELTRRLRLGWERTWLLMDPELRRTQPGLDPFNPALAAAPVDGSLNAAPTKEE